MADTDFNQRVLMSVNAVTEQRDNAISRLSNDDILAVENKLEELLSLSRAAYTMTFEIDNMPSNEPAMAQITAIRSMARSTVKGLDACIERLTGNKIGNFATEFDYE